MWKLLDVINIIIWLMSSNWTNQNDQVQLTNFKQSFFLSRRLVYCSHWVNIISFSLFQSDHIKWLPSRIWNHWHHLHQGQIISEYKPNSSFFSENGKTDCFRWSWEIKPTLHRTDPNGSFSTETSIPCGSNPSTQSCKKICPIQLLLCTEWLLIVMDQITKHSHVR